MAAVQVVYVTCQEKYTPPDFCVPFFFILKTRRQQWRLSTPVHNLSPKVMTTTTLGRSDGLDWSTCLKASNVPPH